MASMTPGHKYYQSCFVPQCGSTTVRTPEKLFVYVPRKVETRRRWFDAARRIDKDYSPKTIFYCCEDHFQTEDFSNKVKHELTGCPLTVKKNVVPTLFDCQPDRKRSHRNTVSPTTVARQQKALVESLLLDDYKQEQERKALVESILKNSMDVSQTAVTVSRTDPTTEPATVVSVAQSMKTSTSTTVTTTVASTATTTTPSTYTTPTWMEVEFSSDHVAERLQKENPAAMDGDPSLDVTIKQEDPLAAGALEGPAAAELGQLQMDVAVAVKEEPPDSDEEVDPLLMMPAPIADQELGAETAENNPPAQFTVSSNAQLPLPAIKMEPPEIQVATAGPTWDNLHATRSLIGLPRSCIQPGLQIIPTANFTTAGLNLPHYVAVPILCNSHNAHLSSALGSQAQTAPQSHFIGPLLSSVSELIPEIISNETIIPDLIDTAPPGPEIKQEREDSLEIILPTLEVTAPHTAKPQSSETSVSLKKLLSSQKSNKIVVVSSKNAPPKDIPRHVEPQKRHRKRDSSKGDSCGVTSRAKRRKGVLQDDSNVQGGPDEVIGQPDGDPDSSSESSLAPSCNGLQDEDEDDLEKWSATQSMEVSSLMTQSQELEETGITILGRNSLLEIFMDLNTGSSNPVASVGSETRLASKNVPETVPLVISGVEEDRRDREVKTEGEESSVQEIRVVNSSGGGIIRTYSRRNKCVESVKRDSVTELRITAGQVSECGTNVHVESKIEIGSVDTPREMETEVRLRSSSLHDADEYVVEPKDETIDVTETTVQSYDSALETVDSALVSKDSMNLIKCFSLALCKTVEGVMSKENALVALRFAVEKANCKTAMATKNIFTESLKSLEACPAEVFAKENDQTVKSNVRCMVKEVYNIALLLRDDSLVNLTAECKKTLESIVKGCVGMYGACIGVRTRTVTQKGVQGESSQDGSEATGRDLYSSWTGPDSEPLVSLPCPCCTLAFASQHELETHRARKHSGTGPFTCYSCGKVWPTKRKLLRHISYHGPRTYKCDICDKGFSTLSNAKKHRAIHPDKYQCSICKQLLNTEDCLKEHMLTHEETLLLKCEICGKQFKKQWRLSTHRIRMHFTKLPYQCQVCKKNFRASWHLKQHNKCHTKDQSSNKPSGMDGESADKDANSTNTFHCSICSRTFSTHHKLETHKVVKHSGPGPFTCYSCGKVWLCRRKLVVHLVIHRPRVHTCKICGRHFPTVSILSVHMKTHTSQHQCHICNKMLTTTQKLKHHLLIHEGARPHQCDKCGKRFRLRQALKIHQRGVHLDGYSYQCDICGRTFKSSACLRRHKHQSCRNVQGAGPTAVSMSTIRYTASNQTSSYLKDPRFHCDRTSKPDLDVVPDSFHCDLCNLSFTLQHAHETHRVKEHSGSGPFTCYSCCKVCPTRGKLLRHLVIHSPRVHTCNICSRSYPTRSTFNCHMKTHSGEYQCNICKKNFTAAKSLKHHLLIHEGARPHECDECGKRFRFIENLKSHKQFVHSDVYAYRCNICGREFKRIKCLRKHQEQRCRCVQEDDSIDVSKSAVRYTATDKPAAGLGECAQLGTDVGPDPLPCDICNVAYPSRLELEIHSIKRHTDTGPFTCYSCGKVGQSKHKLLKHLRRHGPRVHSCNVCGKAFPTLSTLKDHSKYHTNKHSCHICHATFTASWNLQRHLRCVHSTDKCYKCDVCGRGFNCKYSLTGHMSVHSRHLPFQCEVCQKKFKSKKGWMLHQAKHKTTAGDGSTNQQKLHSQPTDNLDCAS